MYRHSCTHRPSPQSVRRIKHRDKLAIVNSKESMRRHERIHQSIGAALMLCWFVRRKIVDLHRDFDHTRPGIALNRFRPNRTKSPTHG